MSKIYFFILNSKKKIFFLKFFYFFLNFFYFFFEKKKKKKKTATAIRHKVIVTFLSKLSLRIYWQRQKLLDYGVSFTQSESTILQSEYNLIWYHRNDVIRENTRLTCSVTCILETICRTKHQETISFLQKTLACTCLRVFRRQIDNQFIAECLEYHDIYISRLPNVEMYYDQFFQYQHSAIR